MKMSGTNESNKVDKVLLKARFGLACPMDRAEEFTMAIRELSTYVNCKYGSNMRNLLKYSKEYKVEKPEHPGDDAGKKQISEWESEIREHRENLTKYAREKGQVFGLLMKQCTKLLAERVERDSRFQTAEMEDDVVTLLTILKEMSLDSSERKYLPYQGVIAFKRLSMLKQGDKESLTQYRNRFIAATEVFESKFGPIMPAKYTTATISDEDFEESLEEAREKFLAMLFMDGAYKKTYGDWLKKLGERFAHNDGSDCYPTDVNEAYEIMHVITPDLKECHKHNAAKDSSDKEGEGEGLRASFAAVGVKQTWNGK